MSEAPSQEQPPVERARVDALVAAQVRVRFALDAVTFGDRLVELARSLSPDRTTEDQVRRLSLDDLYLAMACARGEEQAWEECLSRHGGFLRDFARHFLREPAASDVADQVIGDLWERGKMARYEGRSTLRTWLGAIVAHASLNALKTDRRSPPLHGAEQGRGPQGYTGSESEAFAGRDRSLLEDLVKQALEGLAPEGKLLLLLYYEQDLTLDEMGVTLHASKATLSRRLKRARDVLRASIDALARGRAGASVESLRAGIDLQHLELDLGVLLGGSAVERKPGGAV